LLSGGYDDVLQVMQNYGDSNFNTMSYFLIKGLIEKSLSMAGREVLIKAVEQSIPSYVC